MKFRLLGLCTMLFFFLAGAWFWPSQAQRASQKTSPTGTAARTTKAPAPKPGRPGQRPELVPISAQAVGFAEIASLKQIARANQSISNTKNGPPEVEGHEVNEKNSEEVKRGVISSKPSV